jgi:hypothetical protein
MPEPKWKFIIKCKKLNGNFLMGSQEEMGSEFFLSFFGKVYLKRLNIVKFEF